MHNNLDFLKAHPTFDKQEIIEKGTYYTTYKLKTERDIPHYKTLSVQYFKNFVILLEYETSSVEQLAVVERDYFETTKAQSLKECCYRFLPKLDKDNSSRSKDGDLLEEKVIWCILSDGLIKEIKSLYSKILNIEPRVSCWGENNNTSRYKFLVDGVVRFRAISTLFTLLSSTDNLWESFKAINIVNRTRFLPLSANNSSHGNLERQYLLDTNAEKLSELTEVILLKDYESSYRYFYAEDVEAEKERRHQKAEADKKEWEKEWQEILEYEARDNGNFGYHAAMVSEGELHPDDPEYPF